MPGLTGSQIIARRHPEYTEHRGLWEWLSDSLEGGRRYRTAIYGWDTHGLPIRNLVRHKREYPSPNDLQSQLYYSSIDQPGQDVYRPASTDDDYELRRARTPIPTFTAEAVDGWLSRIFAKKVKRSAPDGGGFDPLRAWWANVDGRGSKIDVWMLDVFGRNLLALGMLDVLVDYPASPAGEKAVSRSDDRRLGLDRLVATIILPQNMLWWSLDSRGCYEECLVQESTLDDQGRKVPTYRHWTKSGWTLYGKDGETIDSASTDRGFVPIRRFFVRRKVRCDHVGTSPVESVAERQREYYNRDSELILSDTLQAHPLIQGPEDFVDADGSVPIGPNWLLPKKKNTQGGSATYEPFEVLDFPKGAAESLRANKGDIRDDVDRDACLLKPAGAKSAGGSGNSTVAQSGVSKEHDAGALNDRLAAVSRLLASAEMGLARLALQVSGQLAVDATTDVAVGVQVVYPTVFSLYSSAEVSAAATSFQAVLAASGDAPTAERLFLTELFRTAIPGLDDETYEEVDAEIAAAIDRNNRRSERDAESGQPRRTAIQPFQPKQTEAEPDDDEPAVQE